MTEPTPTTAKLDMRKLLPILIIVLVDLIGATIILPLLPLYATTFGADPVVIGFLSAAYPLFQFIGAPILGRYSDRFGRKPILLISQVGSLLGFLLLGFAWSLFILFLSRIIDGISGANISVAQAAIADSSTEENRTQAYGLIGAAFGVGFIIGPVLAFVALAATNNDYRAPAFVAAAFSFLSIILTTLFFQETLPPEKRGVPEHHDSGFSLSFIFRALALPVVGLLLILTFVEQLAFGAMTNFFSLFTLTVLGFNAAANSLIFVFIGVILIVVQGGLVGRWSKRYGDRNLVFAGLALMTLGLALTALTPHLPPPWYDPAQVSQELSVGGSAQTTVTLPPADPTGWFGVIWLLLAQIPTAVGASIIGPSLGTLLTKNSEPTQVGAILGINTSMLSAANVVAPLLGGILFQYGSAAAPLWFGAILMGILIPIGLHMIKPEPRLALG